VTAVPLLRTEATGNFLAPCEVSPASLASSTSRGARLRSEVRCGSLPSRAIAVSFYGPLESRRGEWINPGEGISFPSSRSRVYFKRKDPDERGSSRTRERQWRTKAATMNRRRLSRSPLSRKTNRHLGNYRPRDPTTSRKSSQYRWCR